MRPGDAALRLSVARPDAPQRHALAADEFEALDALVDWERRPRAAMRVGLGPVRDLLARLGHPERALRVVHVAGTKGKGSVCALVEAGLLHAGLRAGRYASPHVERLEERISLGGRPIGERELRGALRRALDARAAAVREGSAGAAASWFDTLTAAAFRAFAAAGLEWAVVEVGLGGRLDSTNVVQPELAIITNIGLEHCDVLGATREAIAAEKAGIVKPGRPLLTPLAPDDPAGRVVAAQACRLGAPLHRVTLSADDGIRAGNLLLARRALALLGERGVVGRRTPAALGESDLPPHVADAARLPARLEAFELPARRHGTGPIPLLLDGAHVDFALRAVLQEAGADARRAARPVVVLALGPDKNAAAMAGVLAGAAARVVCTRAGGGRAGLAPRELQQCCAAHGIPSEAIDDPHVALARALDAVGDGGGWVLVTGSLHLAGTLRASLAAATGQKREGLTSR